MDTSEKSVALTAVKKNIKCFKCGHSGHFKKDCKNNSDNQNVKRCYVCNKKGHLKSECRFNSDNSNKKQAKDSKDSNAFIVTVMVDDEQSCYNKWLVDSGASEHMTFDRTLFVSYSTLLNKRSVIIGDGRKLDAVGVGQIVVKAFNGKCYIETTLNNVLHVPDLKMNLFSVASAVNKGYSMKADINKSNVGYSLKDWHEKMAHQNFECVKDILKNNNIKFTGKANTCTECLKGKQHRLLFQRSESSKTGKDFDLKNLQVFGTEAYVHIPKEKRKKWDLKGEKGIFVGYGETTKGYRVYFPEKETVEIKRDVIFVTPEEEENWKEDRQHPICLQDGLILEQMEGGESEQTESSIDDEEESEPRIEEIQETEGESDEEYETPNEEGDIPTNTTRSGRRVRRPQRLNDYKTGFIISLDNEPTSYAEAMRREDADKWKKAVNNELNLLNENNTWTSIYGLKKSPRYWNQTFDEVVSSEGYVKSSKDCCLYTKCNDSVKMFVLLYVDDILLFGNCNTEIRRLKEVLSKSFKMKDMGRITKYLGMNIEQDLEKGITKISQTEYLKNILEIYGMSECKPLSLPIDKNFKFDTLKRNKSESKEIETECKKLIGCLMYAVMGSRPDRSAL
ncbi:transposon unclassified [Lasius niger]|uniref:Transposon unclassified n=1 Tax=Lasius niger TaxID=67767 RepID=A0A0J7KA52_LASNI|nr:transposon unclassified [Lasius niger]